jgi:hypothetical protein
MTLYSIEELEKLMLGAGFQSVNRISKIQGLQMIAEAQLTGEGKVTLVAEKSR